MGFRNQHVVLHAFIATELYEQNLHTCVHIHCGRKRGRELNPTSSGEACKMALQTQRRKVATEEGYVLEVKQPQRLRVRN